MAVQPILLFGDPALRTPAEPVTTFDRELRRLVDDLVDTMRAAPGAGLAAPQLGVSLRVFVYATDEGAGHLVNPVIGRLTEEEMDGPEGCLSLPGLSFVLRRPRAVVARGRNAYGDSVAIEGSNQLARCLQHETDHLDGVLFVDRLDPEARTAALRAVREAQWGARAPVVRVSPHPLFGSAR